MFIRPKPGVAGEASVKGLQVRFDNDMAGKLAPQTPNATCDFLEAEKIALLLLRDD